VDPRGDLHPVPDRSYPDSPDHHGDMESCVEFGRAVSRSTCRGMTRKLG
jgi:hypothetical protein